MDEREEKEFFCLLCGCFYIELVMLNCGYMLCKICIILVGEIFVLVVYCKLCGFKNYENNLLINVLVL